MGQGRSQALRDSSFSKGARNLIGERTFVFDLIEFWIAGVIGLAIFGSIVVTTVHGGLPWECEEHVKLVSGAADLGIKHNLSSPDEASHYECEYMTSTAKYHDAGMCPSCTEANQEKICDAHEKSLGCKWYSAADYSTLPAKSSVANSDLCTVDGDPGTAAASCCLYNPPTKDDQLHDVCYSIDQYVHDEHYPNFVGKYQEQVDDARMFAILSYSFGFAAFAARVLYHVPFLSNAVGGEEYQKSRDYWVRLADLAFLITAFVFTIMTFTKLDDVLIDNRKHLWGTGGVFKEKAHRDSVEEQIVASTGFYALAVYATFLGINVVWFLGTQVGIIPNHPTDGEKDTELRGIAFRSEHA